MMLVFMVPVAFIHIGVQNGLIVAMRISNDVFSIQKLLPSVKSDWTLDESKVTTRWMSFSIVSMHRNKCSLHVQCRAFEAQLKLAAKWNKPIVIHSRDAYEETFKLMKEVRSPILLAVASARLSSIDLFQYLAPDHKVHLHCFVGNLDHVDLFTSYFTEMKFGFTPIISRNSLLHPVLQQLELHQILCETDSPYFIPDEVYHYRSLEDGYDLFLCFSAIQCCSLCSSRNGLQCRWNDC